MTLADLREIRSTMVLPNGVDRFVDALLEYLGETLEPDVLDEVTTPKTA